MDLPGAGEKQASRLLLVGLRRGRHAVLVLRLLDRNRIDAAQPAVQIDVGATPAAERPGRLSGRLTADRAWLGAKRGASRALRGLRLGRVGHDIDMLIGHSTA